MNIIRRRRTITIETCAFRRWQTEGEGESFSCSNCGMTFKQDLQLTAADPGPAGLLTEAVPDAKNAEPSAAATKDAGSPCTGPCVDKT